MPKSKYASEFIGKMTSEEIRKLDVEIEKARSERIAAELEKRWQAEDEDSIRPMFQRDCTKEEKNFWVEAFKMSELYDLLCLKYSGEEMQEFLWGNTPWKEYLSEKSSKNK